MNSSNKLIRTWIHSGILSLIFFVALDSKAQSNQETIKTKSEKKGFTTNIEKKTKENQDFRKVLYTSTRLQLVLMSLKPNEDIGEEIHNETDQFFRVESGHGTCKINNSTYTISDGDVIIIPAGSKHNITNTSSDTELKMYSIYSPPHHKDRIIRATKKEAAENMQEFDGKTTE